MVSHKANEGDVLVGTCRYCGAQTYYPVSALKGSEPLMCGACGAPLEIEVPRPPGKRAEKEEKFLTCGKCGIHVARSDIHVYGGFVCCPACYTELYDEHSQELRQIIIRVTTGLIIMAVLLVFLFLVKGC